MSPRPVVLGALALAALVLGGCGGSSSSASASRPARSVTAPTTATTATVPRMTSTATVSALPRPAPKPNPGSLPQTDQRPSADTPAFHSEMNALWDGVQRNSTSAALPAFFPERAYLQLKQLADAGGDYTGRLLVDYGLDLGAAHALLGGDPGSAQLVGVQVPESYAHWVDPGVCYNAVGYYEVPNARVVYRQSGQVHSFGIASMISWRGVWYVVHLGAILRSGAGGVVDDPSAGVGASAPSSTC
jgi:hypothetical protein